MLQYYLGIPDPGLLPDKEWAEKFQILQMIREKEKESSSQDISNLFGGNK